MEPSTITETQNLTSGPSQDNNDAKEISEFYKNIENLIEYTKSLTKQNLPDEFDDLVDSVKEVGVNFIMLLGEQSKLKAELSELQECETTLIKIYSNFPVESSIILKLVTMSIETSPNEIDDLLEISSLHKKVTLLVQYTKQTTQKELPAEFDDLADNVKAMTDQWISLFKDIGEMQITKKQVQKKNTSLKDKMKTRLDVICCQSTWKD